MVGGSRAKYSDVELVYIQVKALCRMAHNVHFSNCTKGEFSIFLKIEKFKIIDNITEKPLYRHTNGTHGFVVQNSICGVIPAPL